MSKLKKLTSLVVALCMVASVGFAAACTSSESGGTSGGTDSGTDSGTTSSSDATYTYSSYYTSSPTTWNPHTWEDNTDSIILGYISIGFYDVQLTYDENGNADGYEWVAEMAADMPEDVTSEYVGSYGVSSGETQKAWRITLNQAATWEDGTAITADDYIYSMQMQLSPTMLNRRADSYTGSTFAIYGAYNYLYSETEATYVTVSSQGYETNAEAIAAGETLYIDMWNFWGMEGMVDEDGNECPQWVAITDTTLYRDLAVDEGEEGDWVSGAYIWEYYGAYFEVGGGYDDYLSILVENEYLDYEWYLDESNPTNSGVGLIKVDDYTIDIILTNATSEFYVKYNLSSNWLVNKELYESCLSEEDGLVVSTYCTSLDTTISYGPYKLTSYVSGTGGYFTLEKNENWYGYTDGNHEGQYQTTNIDYTCLDSTSYKSQAYERFMLGQLSEYTLDGTEMSTFGSSSYLVSEPQSYTYQFFLSTNSTFLEGESSMGENHAVLGLTTFRKAMSFAINRSEYIQQFSPTSEAGLGMINYMYVYDPDTGEAYRDTEEAMMTILLAQDFYEVDGVWYDVHGEAFGTLEEAYDALTGYDVKYAAELFAQAYQEAKTEGYIDQYGSDIVINYLTTTVSDTTTQMIQMFNTWFAAALAETEEGVETFSSITIEIQQVESSDLYWNYVQSGEADLAFAAWGGSAMDVWGLIYSCYIDPSNSLNYGFDSIATGIDITVEYNGTEYTASLYDWAVWLNNGQADSAYDEQNLYTILGYAVGDAENAFKLAVFSACELAQLQTYCNLPIYYSNVAYLCSAQVNYGSRTYVSSLIGFGGIRHLTYNYTDEEWAAFVSAQGGNLESYYTAN